MKFAQQGLFVQHSSLLATFSFTAGKYLGSGLYSVPLSHVTAGRLNTVEQEAASRGRSKVCLNDMNGVNFRLLT